MHKQVGIEVTSEKDVAVVVFKAASISNVEEITALAEQIDEFIEENHPDRIVIDFERVKFFSSRVLGMLLAIRAKLEPYNGEVVISAINPQLHRVFKITRLDKIFRFFPDKKTAVKILGTDTNSSQI